MTTVASGIGGEGRMVKIRDSGLQIKKTLYLNPLGFSRGVMAADIQFILFEKESEAQQEHGTQLVRETASSIRESQRLLREHKALTEEARWALERSRELVDDHRHE